MKINWLDFEWDGGDGGGLMWGNPWEEGNLPPTPSPRSVASLPRFGPPFTNPGCTTVNDGIARGHKGACPAPLIRVQEIWGQAVNYPLIIAFNVQEKAIFIHELQN